MLRSPLPIGFPDVDPNARTALNRFQTCVQSAAWNFLSAQPGPLAMPCHDPLVEFGLLILFHVKSVMIMSLL
jgi:hypothetical protein